MFNIFEEENEEISEQAKVHMLLKKVEHPQLQNAIIALRVRASMDSTTFTECANHLSAQVSELPDYQASRKVAASNSKTTPIKRIRGGGAQNSSGRKRNGINMPDGSIWTGYYSDWESMDKDNKQKVMDARKKNKAKSGKKNRQVSDVSSTPEKNLKEIKAQVAALKRSLPQLKSSSNDSKETDNVDDDDDDTPDNAGDSFGGRSRKKSKKD
jgi:hypothetical protein